MSAAQGETKRRALGKGLESLLPSRPISVPVVLAVAEEQAGRPLEIKVELIDRNPYQTRAGFDEEKLKELAASIAATGVVQPIVVRPGKNGRFTLITGERRLLASKQAGKPTVPAIVREVSRPADHGNDCCRESTACRPQRHGAGPGV